ncbi:MAG: hypothetical protein M1490_05610 [Candidatus Bathyarchaeota archaeon]|nr:hypothetical protein [Candidatus Bathyarchaeota archaeon]
MTYKNYVVCSSEDRVQVWSVDRLPFPTGTSDIFKSMRREIQQALLSMQANGKVLHAIYISPRGFSGREPDVENALFYNVSDVSCQCFKELTKNGIRFERLFSRPPLSDGKPRWNHSQIYMLSPIDAEFTYWRRGRHLVHFDLNILCNIFENIKTNYSVLAKFIWYWVRQSGEKVLIMVPKLPPSRFGISITIEGDKNLIPNLSAFVKPLLDGVIAAYQNHDGTNLDNITIALSTRYLKPLNPRQDDLISFLTNNKEAILGSTKLFWLSSGGRLQVCPNDENCLSAEIILLLKNSDCLKIHGVLFEIYEA